MWRNWQTCLPAGRRALKKYDYYLRYKKLTKNYIYVGLTNNLERRVSQHNLGKEKTTKPYAPFLLIYKENFLSRREARSKEKYLKSGFGKEFLKSL
ncbi:MAG: endonuclease [Parcubacteria group bacterium CG10_big_fil_rev_8_21_14_0_10_36_14]|nr:MAG: endonuclease [Parcubacteria group bacterium CG10_big_fil_rev_8_21_14_0_10_36_14]